LKTVHPPLVSLTSTLIVLSLPIFFLMFPTKVFAQVVINEILPDPDGDDTDNEWIEIFNPDNLDLNGYVLEDKNGKKIILTNIVDKWAVIYPHGEGGFAITNTGSTIKLYESSLSTEPINSYSYEGSTKGKSWGRLPDGGAEYALVLDPSPGSSNQAPTPTPTPIPTLTSTPTSTPTLTPTPTPIPIPTATPKKSLSPRPSPNLEPDVEGLETTEPTDIQDLRNQLTSVEPVATEGGATQKKSPGLPIFLIVGGVSCMGVSGYFVFKNMKSNGESGYNNPDGQNS
jgi:hypothetical protein